jgi:hypothetical protein
MEEYVIDYKLLDGHKLSHTEIKKKELKNFEKNVMIGNYRITTILLISNDGKMKLSKESDKAIRKAISDFINKTIKQEVLKQDPNLASNKNMVNMVTKMAITASRKVKNQSIDVTMDSITKDLITEYGDEYL